MSCTKYLHAVLAFSFSPSQVNELVLLVVKETMVLGTVVLKSQTWDVMPL